MLPHSRVCYAAVVIMTVLLAVAPGAVRASTATSGCAGSPVATEANGFFTLSGSTDSAADGCYAISFEGNAADYSCGTACAAGGTLCIPRAPQGTVSDCTTALNWFLSSSAKPSAIPSSPDTGTGFYCTIAQKSDNPYTRTDVGFGMPMNSAMDCSNTPTAADFGNVVTVCKCGPPDTTAPTVSNTNAGQATPSSVTVTGDVDEAATVYCNVAASGASHTATNVKAAGFSDPVGAAGSFTVTVTGVSGDGTKSVACVAEDGSSNLGSASAGADFHFDATSPTLTSVAGSHSGTIATITGSTSEASTVYCLVDTSGATVSPSMVKSNGQSTTVGAAGSFTVTGTVGSVDGRAAYCVGEDGVGNLGSTTSGSFDNVPTDVSLSGSTIAENSAVGTEVGTLTTTDVDVGDTFTYSITTQDVSAAFQIADDKLQVGSGTVDFEATPTLSVTVRTSDSDGLTFDKALTVTVTDVNEAPTGITFSATTVESKAEPGATVGTLSTIDDDGDDSFTYSITTDPSGAFYISGNEVRVGSAFEDLFPGQLVAIKVTTTDSGGLVYTRVVSAEVVRSKNAILPILAITAGVLSVAAAIVAVVYVKSTSTTAAAAGAGGEV